MQENRTPRIGGAGLAFLAIAIAAILIAGVATYQSTVALTTEDTSTTIAELRDQQHAVASVKNEVASLKEQLAAVENNAKDAADQAATAVEEAEHAEKEGHETQEYLSTVEMQTNLARVHLAYVDVTYNIDSLRSWSSRWIEQGNDLGLVVSAEKVERLEKLIDGTPWPEEMQPAIAELKEALEQTHTALENKDVDGVKAGIAAVGEASHGLTHAFYDEWFPSMTMMKPEMPPHEETPTATEPTTPPTHRDIVINVSHDGFNGDKNLLITVNRGDTVKLTVTNVDDVAGNYHGFAIEGLGVNILDAYPDGLAPKESYTFELVAEKPGVYAFVCNIPCLGHGFLQNGQLKVS